MVRLSKSFKSVIIKRLTYELISKVSYSDINDAMVYLSKVNSAFKVIPYNIFKLEDFHRQLSSSRSGLIVEFWLLKETSGISKNFNKGRKLQRLAKSITDDYSDALGFNFSISSNFLTALSSFFVGDIGLDFLPFNLTVSGVDTLFSTLDVIMNYVSAVLFLDLIDTDEYLTGILDIIINSKSKDLLYSVVCFGSLKLLSQSS